VAGFVGILHSGLLAVDAAVEGAGYEEGSFGAAGGEGVYQLGLCKKDGLKGIRDDQELPSACTGMARHRMLGRFDPAHYIS
jgi:hypothetical protein